MGYVRKERVDGRTKAYYLTDKGQRELVAFLDWCVTKYEESA